MKFVNLIIITFMITSIGVQGQPSPKKTIYQFKVTNLEGEEFDFSTLKGKKVMIDHHQQPDYGIQLCESGTLLLTLSLRCICDFEIRVRNCICRWRKNIND